MSEIRFDTLNDSAGTGAPNCPNGIQLGGSQIGGGADGAATTTASGLLKVNKFQTKTPATQTVTTASFETFTLEIGKVYRVYLSCRCGGNSSGRRATIDIIHDSTTLASAGLVFGGSVPSPPAEDTYAAVQTAPFTATNASLEFNSTLVGTAAFINGISITVEQLENYESTTDFT